MSSPMHRHTRSGSGSSAISNMRRPQNTKAAAQRLAQVMAHQSADDDDEEDDFFDPSIPSAGLGLAGGRQARNRSPLSVRPTVDQPPFARSTPGVRSSASVNSPSYLRPYHSKSAEPPPSTHSSNPGRSSQATDWSEDSPMSARVINAARSSLYSNPVEQHSSAYSVPAGRTNLGVKTVSPVQPVTPVLQSQASDSSEEAQPLSSRFNVSGRSSSYTNLSEQPSSARSSLASRSNLGVKTVPVVPPNVPVSVKPVFSTVPAETPPEKTRDKRLSLDFGTFKYKEPSDQQSSSALQDELDMLQEENDSLLEKLRITEERCEEAEARTKQLERQIASLGDGVSLEARLLSRKEAELQKREAALKVASQTYGGSSEEIAALRTEAENARNEVTSALEQLHDAEYEAKSLRIVTQRMILTQEEIEEVVLKRCWLARCWSLCVRFGIHADIAGDRHEYWSSLVSHPVTVIMAAGQKAKDETSSSINSDLEEREKVLHDQDEVSRRANVESMLLVEKGLRELTSLKVEEGIAMSMAQKRRTSMVKSDELRLPFEGQSFSDVFELSQEECEDVLLKRAWLTYFWRRAKNHSVEPDIADDRLQALSNHGSRAPNSHDAVDVERGLMELRKLGVETKLWEEPRRLVDPDSAQKTLSEIEFN